MSTFKLSKTTDSSEAMAHFLANAGETGTFQKTAAKIKGNHERAHVLTLDATADLMVIAKRLLREGRKVSEVRTLCHAAWVGTGKSLSDAKKWVQVIFLSLGEGTNANGESFDDVPTNSRAAFREFLSGFKKATEIRGYFGVGEFAKKKDAAPKGGDGAGTDTGTDTGDTGTGDAAKTDAERLAELNALIRSTGRLIGRALTPTEAAAIRLSMIESGLVKAPEQFLAKRDAA